MLGLTDRPVCASAWTLSTSAYDELPQGLKDMLGLEVLYALNPDTGIRLPDGEKEKRSTCSA